MLPVIFKISRHWEANKIAPNNGGDFENLWKSSSQTFGTGQMPLGCSFGHIDLQQVRREHNILS